MSRRDPPRFKKRVFSTSCGLLVDVVHGCSTDTEVTSTESFSYSIEMSRKDFVERVSGCTLHMLKADEKEVCQSGQCGRPAQSSTLVGHANSAAPSDRHPRIPVAVKLG